MLEEKHEEISEVLIRVQIIRRKSDLTLVQWEEDGAPMRAWVVPSMIVEADQNSGLVRNPQEGVPYGERWNEFLEVAQVTPEMIDRELKRRGIWTIEDLEAKPNVARHCIQRVYGFDLAELLRATARKKKSHGE